MAPLLVLVLGTLAASACSGSSKITPAPKPARDAPSPVSTRSPAPRALGSIRVADDRHYLEKRADRDDARLNEMLDGALWRAERACRERPADQRKTCEDAELEASSRQVLQRAQDALGRLEAMNRTCDKVPLAERDACAARFVAVELPEQDRWAAEAERAREILGCEAPERAVYAACRALAAFDTGASLPPPAPRWIGAAIAGSYRGYIHHELVMGALETHGAGVRLCLAFVTPDDARDRADLQSAIRDLLLGRPPSGNRAFEFARTYAFIADDCKTLQATARGAWVSLDGKWQATRSGAALAVRARQWGPGHVLMLAELGAVKP